MLRDFHDPPLICDHIRSVSVMTVAYIIRGAPERRLPFNRLRRALKQVTAVHPGFFIPIATHRVNVNDTVQHAVH